MAKLLTIEGTQSTPFHARKRVGEPLQLKELVVRHVDPGFMITYSQEDAIALEHLFEKDPLGKKAELFLLTPDQHVAIIILAGQSHGINLGMDLYLPRPIMVSLLSLPIEAYRKKE
jgi:hypothetical protein